MEEKVQSSTISSPKFSTCCESGVVMMNKFDDSPQPLYSLLMDSTAYIFPSHIFTDNERLYNFVKIFEIITMPLHAVLLALKETSPFTVLEVYILFVSKGNYVI